MTASHLTTVPEAPECRVPCVLDMRRNWWLEGFIGTELLCQLILALFPVGDFRPVIRFISYAVSLALLALLPGKGKLHPAARWAMAILAIVGLSMLHPTTNSVVAGAAQVSMYVAILAPLFWVARLPVDSAQLRRVLLILWAFHIASCIVAIIQVMYPGLLPQNLTSLYGSSYLETNQYRNASGDLVFRPLGLSDVPGAASVSGFYAALIGLGVLAREHTWWFRIAALFGLGAGFTTLYLTEVRSMLVMLVICIIAMLAVLLWAGEIARAATLSFALVIVVMLSYTAAITVGGEAVSQRLRSLFEVDPDQVYYENRGRFISDTVETLLPEYPLGAGLGRWGMMNEYFGDNSDPRRSTIWVEIQWSGWLLDGGVPLILTYLGGIGSALWVAWRIATGSSQPALRGWAAVVLAYNIGALAMTFNYPFFQSQSAMELWMLNAALFSARDHIRVGLFVHQ
jgi:hypothetical protein